MHVLEERLRGLYDLMPVGAQLGCLRSAMETGPWFDGVESSIVSMRRRSWARQRPASSEEENRCFEGNELRVSCRGDVVPSS